MNYYKPVSNWSTQKDLQSITDTLSAQCLFQSFTLLMGNWFYTKILAKYSFSKVLLHLWMAIWHISGQISWKRIFSGNFWKNFLLSWWKRTDISGSILPLSFTLECGYNAYCWGSHFTTITKQTNKNFKKVME